MRTLAALDALKPCEQHSITRLTTSSGCITSQTPSEASTCISERNGCVCVCVCVCVCKLCHPTRNHGQIAWQAKASGQAQPLSGLPYFRMHTQTVSCSGKLVAAAVVPVPLSFHASLQCSRALSCCHTKDRCHFLAAAPTQQAPASCPQC